MVPAAPEPEIFEAALRGEDAAWAVLHRQWAPAVMSWCRFLGGDRIDTDEAARDVFFRLWRTADRIRGPSVFRAFLYGITRRVVSEHRRRAWIRRWVGEPVVEPTDTLSDSPHKQIADKQLAAEVREVLEELSARDR